MLYIQKKIIVIENQLKKLYKFVFYMIVWKTKLFGVGFVRLDSGIEPNLSGSESGYFLLAYYSYILTKKVIYF